LDNNGGKMIEKKLELLKDGIFAFAKHCTNMLDKSLKGLYEKNKNLLEEVIQKDETLSNDYDMRFDDLCIICLARYQPNTKNLRLIVSSIKINSDLERISDHCVNISQSAGFILDSPYFANCQNLLKEIGELVSEMSIMTAKAFMAEDDDLANNVLKRDDAIDKLKDEIIAQTCELVSQSPQNASAIFRIANIAKNLERIADLNTNICEEIIYWSDGQNIRHHNI
jgi:phosphate transport system protein